MDHSSERVAGSIPTNPQGEQGFSSKVFSPTEYKKFAPSKTEKCFCGTCDLLGSDVIRSIYNLEHMIEDNNSQIFQFFGKYLVK